ncbi:MAG: Rne/Rng family ribonuclease [Phycisphaerae bacterium]|nr:Rne/Rng family ribonuclease [Phycisphaerae bacterium]
MLINVSESEECRIAVLRDNRLDELFIERTSASSNVGNIYKGRVTNVEPSIQAAFVDFGLPAHGFLHISDLHPQYFPDGTSDSSEQVGKKTPRRQRPPIQSCLKRGQEVIVQVIKEGIGTKGPTLTSYISLPGRFLVMMPGMDQLGVSRKIEDENTRRRIRALLDGLTLPEGIGFIVRTAGVDRTRRDLQRDLNFLVRLWRQVERRIKTDPAPAELYKESDLVIRTIRDVYDSSLRRIVVDSSDVADRIREFLAIASPRTSDGVEVYQGDEPIFHHHGIEAEIERLNSKTVPLPSGGSLIIEQTEAMVAIDVNSGRFRVPENAEETAYRVNLEAVDEIARQLRLRDLGGLIVCDLIDMGLERHRRSIEKRLADALRKHKERAKILRISRFGLLEMTRQRQRPSLLKSVFRECPRCAGSGRVKSSESVALDVMRQIRLASNREGIARIDVRLSTAVANDLLNRKRHQLTDLERAKNQTIQIHGVETFGVDQVELACTDLRGREVGINAIHPNHDSNRGGNRFSNRGGRRRGGRGRGRGTRPNPTK